MGFFSDLFGGSGGNLDIPEYQEDPYYKKTQDILLGQGKNILAGVLILYLVT